MEPWQEPICPICNQPCSQRGGKPLPDDDACLFCLADTYAFVRKLAGENWNDEYIWT